MKYQRKSNQGFDRFLIHEWLESCEEISATEECGKEIRKQAYQAFRKAAKGEKPADLHTMRRWFGLDGISSPNREMVFHIAISLKLSVNDCDCSKNSKSSEASSLIKVFSSA